MKSAYSMIVTTYPTIEAAKQAAQLLVEQRLAACIHLLPIESIYFWDGKICEDNEITLFIKSKTALFQEIAALIKENHSYAVPEIIQMPITEGLPEYLKWLGGSTK
jgi:periplasmic divalent cation tolerance protein